LDIKHVNQIVNTNNLKMEETERVQCK